MKIGFYVAGYHGYKTLEKFSQAPWQKDHEVIFIESYQTKGLQIDYMDSIKKIAELLDAHFNFINTYAEKDKCDVVFVIGWQFKFDKITDNMIVLHDSFLPNYRGFAPTVNALIDGVDLGVTAFKPEEGDIDTGLIYCQENIAVDYPMTISNAYDFVTNACISLIHQIISNKGLPTPSILNEDDQATYSMWRDNFDYYIDWNWDVQKIKRFVDAIGYPYNYARTVLQTHSIIINAHPYRTDIKVFEVEEVFVDKPIINRKDHIGKIFKIDEGNPIVVCNNGFIKLTQWANEFNDNFKFKLRSRFIKGI